MPNIQKRRDAEVVKPSAVPETALHSLVPVRTQFSHDIFFFNLVVDIDVGINRLYKFDLNARPFHPLDVAVDRTGWYIVFANSTQGFANMRQCCDQLNNQISALPVILSCIQLQQTFAIEVHLGNRRKIHNGAKFMY